MNEEKKAVVIAVSNQKGGVGKTSTVNAFASGLTRKGLKVLVIDMDPQGNLSASVNADRSQDALTTYEVLKEECPAADAIQHMRCFDIIPADLSLAVLDRDLFSDMLAAPYKLKNQIEPLRSIYDFIVIDTAPSLSILTINALTAANEVLIPATAEFFATTGLEQLADTINKVRKYGGNPGLKVDGILFTMHDPRTINGQAIKEATKAYAASIGTTVFDTYIRKSVAMGESQTNRIDIYTFSPKSTVARDYAAFVDEYLKFVGRAE